MYQSKSVVVVTFLARHGTNLKRKEERRSWRPRTTKSENRWDDIWNATTEKNKTVAMIEAPTRRVVLKRRRLKSHCCGWHARLWAQTLGGGRTEGPTDRPSAVHRENTRRRPTSTGFPISVPPSRRGSPVLTIFLRQARR